MPENAEPHIPNYKGFCSVPNSCIELKARVEELERHQRESTSDAAKVSASLNRIESVFAEREKTSNKVWNGLLAVMALLILNFGTLVYWIGGTNERLSYFKESDARQNEVIFRLEHPSQQSKQP